MPQKPPLEADVIIVGASDQATVVLDILRRSGSTARVREVVDASPDGRYVGRVVDGYPVTMTIAELLETNSQHSSLIPAVGDHVLRAAIVEHADRVRLEVGSLIDPTAVISPTAEIARGTVVSAGAYIGAHARVGVGTIVNTRAVVEHHVTVGGFCHIAPGVVLSGRVIVGDRTTIGAGACVRDEVRLGDDVTVGMGAAVVADVRSGSTVTGVPARERGPQ